jgi:putative membrane protein insertion efficiency factor
VVASGKARFYPALMLGLVRFFIRIYQCTLSPLLRLLCGPNSGCRFTPTCSAYLLEAVEVHGIRHGSWLGLKRLARCQPWGGCGYDPVPDGGNETSFRAKSRNPVARPMGNSTECLDFARHDIGLVDRSV